MAAKSKADKMYANSPTLETDDAGKKYIKKNSPTKAEKKSAQVSDGTDGLQADQIKQKHSGEMFEMMQRHQKDYMETHTRHMLEAAKGGGNPADGGEGLINKVESGKKE